MSTSAMKVILFKSFVVVVTFLVGTSLAAVVPSAAPEHQQENELPVLSAFRELQRELFQSPDGTYAFYFSLPQQAREEQRNAEGKVSGSFAFVDKVGEEVSVRYEADDEGFRPESDALPQAPEDTEDVVNAREEFLRYYEQTAKFLEDLASDEEESSEESDEDSDEDDEESDSDSDEDSSSEEDDNSEDEEDDDDEDDDDEEEEEENEDEEENEEEQQGSIQYFRFNRPNFEFQQSLEEQVRVVPAIITKKTEDQDAFTSNTQNTQGNSFSSPFTAETFFGSFVPTLTIQ